MVSFGKLRSIQNALLEDSGRAFLFESEENAER